VVRAAGGRRGPELHELGMEGGEGGEEEEEEGYGYEDEVSRLGGLES